VNNLLMTLHMTQMEHGYDRYVMILHDFKAQSIMDGVGHINRVIGQKHLEGFVEGITPEIVATGKAKEPLDEEITVITLKKQDYDDFIDKLGLLIEPDGRLSAI